MSTYNLYRGGKAIAVEKEESFFTVIMPERGLMPTAQKIEGVSEVDRVFDTVFKVHAEEGARDAVMEYFRSSNVNAIAHHAYTPVGEETTRYYITDMIVVSFQENTALEAIEKIMQQHGLQYVRQYHDLGLCYLMRVTASAGKNPLKVAADLMEQPLVLYAEPNLINRFQPSYIPLDGLFARQWHLKSIRDIELVAEADVKATFAWNTTRGIRDIVVAVIDDGFDTTHPDLNGIDKLVAARDFVDNDLFPIPSTELRDFHGTPCAGVAIGEENGDGIVGVAPGCSFMPVRFPLAADDNLLYEIFDYTGKRADVISCSWGPPPVYAPLSSAQKRQIDQLTTTGGPRKKGCVILFAAGNFNAPIQDETNTSFRWLHPQMGIITTRSAIENGYAAHPAILAISASNSLNQKSLYSNWGKEIALCAPSDNWHPLEPQTKLPGRGIWTTDNEKAGLGFSFGSRYTSEFGGTSSATPLAAGIAALVLSANPALSAAEVRGILKSAADKIEDRSIDPILGHNKGTYNSSGHSEWFGFGKVNAQRAVETARAMAEGSGGTVDETALLRGVKINAALINPAGSDRGKETVTLLNISNIPIPLAGWSIVDSRGRQDKFSTDWEINPGSTFTLTLSKAQLSNLGGSITLKNSQGNIVDRVEYSLFDAAAGWQKKF